MRSRHFIALLLSLALLLGQLGGIAHAASHLQGDSKDRPHGACELCVAYAALDAGATSGSAAFHAQACHFAPEAAVWLPVGNVTLPPYASRAPPPHV